MNLSFKRIGLAGIGVLLAGAAIAQIVTAVATPNVNPTDLTSILVNGVATSTNVYASIPQIAGAPGYTNLGAITTGNTYVFGHAVADLFAQPSGTLAAVTLTTETNPSDGQRECFLSTQTTTSLTWNANTGQTMGPTISAGVANTPICLTYQKSSATWFRSP